MIKVPELSHSTNFIVLPKHTNYMYPLIFGGAFFSEMDLCAAWLSTIVISYSPVADNAVTYKANITFLAPCYSGDNIDLRADLVELRDKAMGIEVEAFRKSREKPLDPVKVAEAYFVFIARKGYVKETAKYVNHQLEL